MSRITTSSAFLARRLDAEPRGGNRIGAIEREDGELDLLPELLELVNRSRTLEIASDERGALPVSAEHQAELRRSRRLARALETCEEDHGRRAAEREPRVARAHEGRQLLVHDLHDLLARREALQHVLTESALLDGRREVARDLEIDVGLEQRETDLAHGLRDRLFVETAAAAEPAERRLELVGEGVEHGRTVYVAALSAPRLGSWIVRTRQRRATCPAGR